MDLLASLNHRSANVAAEAACDAAATRNWTKANMKLTNWLSGKIEAGSAKTSIQSSDCAIIPRDFKGADMSEAKTSPANPASFVNTDCKRISLASRRVRSRVQ